MASVEAMDVYLVEEPCLTAEETVVFFTPIDACFEGYERGIVESEVLVAKTDAFTA